MCLAVEELSCWILDPAVEGIIARNYKLGIPAVEIRRTEKNRNQIRTATLVHFKF